MNIRNLPKVGSLWRYLVVHRDSLASIMIRVGGVGLGFVITFYIGRTMGPAANGQYGIITQTGMFLSIMCVGGVDLSVVRSFSAATAKGVPPSRRAMSRLFLCTLALVVAVCAGVALLRGVVIRELLDNSAVPGALAFLCAIFLARAATRLTSSILRSQRAYIFGQLVEVVVIPGIVIIGILAGLARSLETLLALTALAGLVAASLGVIASYRKSSVAADALDVPMTPLFKRAIPLWGVAVSQNLSDWYALAVVAASLSLYDAGVYRVAMQVATALPIVTIGVFSVFSPQIGAAHAKEDFGRIAQLARSATLLSTVLVIPPGLALLLLAPETLTLIGQEFGDGTRILQVMVVGQMCYVMTGPSGLVLAMTGNERVNLTLTGLSLIALLVALPLAVMYGGLLTLVITTSVILVMRNITSLVAVKWLTGVSILTGHYAPVRSSRS
jgi:O-antigen/teichoic acid export membrane protein